MSCRLTRLSSEDNRTQGTGPCFQWAPNKPDKIKETHTQTRIRALCRTKDAKKLSIYWSCRDSKWKLSSASIEKVYAFPFLSTLACKQKIACYSRSYQHPTLISWTSLTLLFVLQPISNSLDLYLYSCGLFSKTRHLPCPGIVDQKNPGITMLGTAFNSRLSGHGVLTSQLLPSGGTIPRCFLYT